MYIKFQDMGFLKETNWNLCKKCMFENSFPLSRSADLKKMFSFMRINSVEIPFFRKHYRQSILNGFCRHNK